ncbi:MAG: response regulator [Deltaproteobacteria bacterium]|nr:response regulator [Deltaproteobacteria bacterium]
MTNSEKFALVADDDSDIRTIVCSAISMLGVTPIEAENGARAISLSESINFDVAVLDVMMPDLSGLEVCRRVKATEMGRYLPIIILTARDNMKDKVSALSDSGADDYLTKPFHYEELQARVRVQLRVRQLNLDLRAKNEELVRMQEKLIQNERQLLATQLAGTAAHSLGQPLSAIMLNCHLLEALEKKDERYKQALSAVKNDAKRMSEMIEKLKGVDAGKTQQYFEKTAILEIKED